MKNTQALLTNPLPKSIMLNQDKQRQGANVITITCMHAIVL